MRIASSCSRGTWQCSSKQSFSLIEVTLLGGSILGEPGSQADLLDHPPTTHPITLLSVPLDLLLLLLPPAPLPPCSPFPPPPGDAEVAKTAESNQSGAAEGKGALV